MIKVSRPICHHFSDLAQRSRQTWRKEGYSEWSWNVPSTVDAKPLYVLQERIWVENNIFNFTLGSPKTVVTYDEKSVDWALCPGVFSMWHNAYVVELKAFMCHGIIRLV